MLGGQFTIIDDPFSIVAMTSLNTSLIRLSSALSSTHHPARAVTSKMGVAMPRKWLDSPRILPPSHEPTAIAMVVNVALTTGVNHPMAIAAAATIPHRNLYDYMPEPPYGGQFQTQSVLGVEQKTLPG
jgi:hypothetical protein